jgi:lipopolysaccharide transport system ATP-binding protein
VSTAWIPGNLLSEGMYFINPAIRTLKPEIRRMRVDDAVGFQVIDNMDGNGARVDYIGNLAGVVRPLLKWETQFIPNGNYVAEETMSAGENSQIDPPP